MATQQSKSEEFRKLHIAGNPLVIYNIWDPGSAKAAIAAGVKAIATSSWAVAEANGFSDGEQTPIGPAIENLRRIVSSTDLPVTVDLRVATAPHLGTLVRLSDSQSMRVRSAAISKIASHQTARCERARIRPRVSLAPVMPPINRDLHSSSMQELMSSSTRRPVSTTLQCWRKRSSVLRPIRGPAQMDCLCQDSSISRSLAS